MEFESTLSESQSEVLTANTKATPNMSNLVLSTGNDPVFLHYQCSVMPLYYESVVPGMRFELTTRFFLLPFERSASANFATRALVHPLGFEPSPHALQAYASTRLA